MAEYGFGFNGFSQYTQHSSNRSSTTEQSHLSPVKLSLFRSARSEDGDGSCQHNIENETGRFVDSATLGDTKTNHSNPVSTFDGPRHNSDAKISERSDVEESNNSHSESDTDLNRIRTISVTWSNGIYLAETGETLYKGFSGSGCPDCDKVISVEGCSAGLTWGQVYVVDKEGVCHVWNTGQVDEQGSLVKDDLEGTILDIESNMNFTHVSCGEKHVILLTEDNRAGVVEHRDGNYIYRPLNLHIAIKSVSCGKEHVLMLSQIGVVFSFGIGGQGQLGHGDVESRRDPTDIEALGGLTISKIAAGGWHSVAVSDIGDMYVWGWNDRGQLGLPSKVIKENKIAAGKKSKTGSYDEEGEMSKADVPGNCSDADGDNGQSADHKNRRGEYTEDYVNIQTLPYIVDLPSNNADDEMFVSEVSCGSRHTAAITDNGLLFTWGWNEYGQLGHGDTESRDLPTAVTYFSQHDLKVRRAFCGAWSTVVIC